MVGDIGGTNARFAIWEDEQLHSIRVFATVDYASPEKALLVYLQDLELQRGDVTSLCLAVAGPVRPSTDPALTARTSRRRDRGRGRFMADLLV